MIPGPSFCWWCMRDLQRGVIGPIYSLVRDPIGHVHRVHHTCVSDARSEGNEHLDLLKPARAIQ